MTMLVAIVMLLAATSLSQSITPTFEVDKCSRQDPLFNGEVGEVTGRALNPTGVYWHKAVFKATFQMAGKESGGKLVEKTGITEVSNLPIGDSRQVTIPAEVLTIGGDPLYGLKAISCKVEFIRGERIILANRLTTNPKVDGVFIASDQACLSDYMTALQLQGLLFRKQISELITYGCVKRLGKGYLVTINDKGVVGVNGRKRLFARATFVANPALLAMGYTVTPLEETGFVPMELLKTAPVEVLDVFPK